MKKNSKTKPKVQKCQKQKRPLLVKNQQQVNRPLLQNPVKSPAQQKKAAKKPKGKQPAVMASSTPSVDFPDNTLALPGITDTTANNINKELTQEAFEKIFLEIACSTKSVKKICLEFGYPFSTVWHRLMQDKSEGGLLNQYAHAKAHQAEYMAEDMLDIADDSKEDFKTRINPNTQEIEEYVDKEHIQRSVLRVELRKWIMSKLLMKKYGDKLGLTDGDGGPLNVQFMTNIPRPDYNNAQTN